MKDCWWDVKNQIKSNRFSLGEHCSTLVVQCTYLTLRESACKIYSWCLSANGLFYRTGILILIVWHLPFIMFVPIFRHFTGKFIILSILSLLYYGEKNSQITILTQRSVKAVFSLRKWQMTNLCLFIFFCLWLNSEPFIIWRKMTLTLSLPVITIVICFSCLLTRPRGRGFEPHRRHCIVVLEQDTFILA